MSNFRFLKLCPYTWFLLASILGGTGCIPGQEPVAITGTPISTVHASATQEVEATQTNTSPTAAPDSLPETAGQFQSQVIAAKAKVSLASKAR